MVKKRVFILMSFLFGIISIVYVWFGDLENVSVLTKEDGAVENLSAILYMVGFIVSVISIFKNERIFLPIFWAVLCFMFLGEETSWFQRVFHYSVQSVEQINSQNEFNLHNLNVFHGGSLADSGIGLSSFLKSQNLFRLGFFGYFIVLPLFLQFPRFKESMSKIGYKNPDTGFSLALFLVFALSFFIALFCPENVKNALAETREMLYAFFIMMYIIAYIWPNRGAGGRQCC